MVSREYLQLSNNNAWYLTRPVIGRLLIFIGATADETFRAFDKETGAILWEHQLPFGGNATPSTYMVDGKQYVVISAGGAKSNRPAGGSLVAFSLP